MVDRLESLVHQVGNNGVALDGLIKETSLVLMANETTINYNDLINFANAVFKKAQNAEAGAERNGIYYYLVKTISKFIELNIKGLLFEHNYIQKMGEINAYIMALSEIKEQIVNLYIQDGDYGTASNFVNEYFSDTVSQKDWELNNNIATDRLNKVKEGSDEWKFLIKHYGEYFTNKLANTKHVSLNNYIFISAIISSWLEKYHDIIWEKAE